MDKTNEEHNDSGFDEINREGEGDTTLCGTKVQDDCQGKLSSNITKMSFH